jgi:hypothetical protein
VAATTTVELWRLGFRKGRMLKGKDRVRKKKKKKKKNKKNKKKKKKKKKKKEEEEEAP